MKKNYKELILAQIDLYPAMTVEKWSEKLQLNNEQEPFFLEAVNELVSEYEIGFSKKKKLLPASELGYIKGKLDVVGKDFGFVDIFDFSVYINAKNFNDAMDHDDVVVHYWKSSGDRYEGEIVSIIKRNTTYILGTMVREGSKLLFKSYDKNITQEIKYGNSNNFELEDQQRVIGDILEYGDPIKVNIRSIIGLVKDPGVDILTILHQYGIKMEFMDTTLKQAQDVPQQIQVHDYPERTDLTDEIIFTIDGDDTKDIDDALSIKRVKNGYQLGVHIADVSHYVTKGSSLDQDAYERGTSVYVVDRVVPMLPTELSNGICSLNPNENRLAMSVHINLDEYGTIVDYEFFESVIRSRAQLTYREVNRFFENNDDIVAIPNEIKPRLLVMKEASDLLRIQYEAHGSIEFETSESAFVVDDTGKILDVYERTRGKGELVIENFMIAANHCAANFFDTQELPTLYRVHERPATKKMQELSATLRVMGYRLKGSLEKVVPSDIQRILYNFKNEPTFHMVSRIVLRSMTKAKYHPQNLGHFGLGLKQYLHFTSPIRRYPDLVVHRQMKKFNFQKKYDKSIIEMDEKELVETALWTSDRERNAVDAEREVEKMKKAQYMSDYVGDTFEGIVSGVTGFGLFVELPNTCEGLVHVRTMPEYFIYDEQKMMLRGRESGDTYQLGQSVNVKVTGVDMTEFEVSMELLIPKKNNKKNGTKKKKPLKRRRRSRA